MEAGDAEGLAAPCMNHSTSERPLKRILRGHRFANTGAVWTSFVVPKMSMKALSPIFFLSEFLSVMIDSLIFFLLSSFTPTTLLDIFVFTSSCCSHWGVIEGKTVCLLFILPAQTE